MHYAVDNTPAMAFRTVSAMLSRQFSPYVDALIAGQPNAVLDAAAAIRGGVVLDPEIFAFRNRCTAPRRPAEA